MTSKINCTNNDNGLNGDYIIVILLSLVSSIGDTLFLTGIPLYFFVSGEGNIVDTTYVAIAITITIVLFQKPIRKINMDGNPLFIVGIGEMTMGAIEIIILILFIYFKSKWILLAAVFPLALVYNFYAASKFFKIQDYFFHSDDMFLTSIQSAAIKLGRVFGISLVAYILKSGGIEQIILLDAISFFIFGSYILMNYFIKGSIAFIPFSKKEPSSNIPNCNLTEKKVQFGLMIWGMAKLLGAWEGASSQAIFAKNSLLSLIDIGNLRAVMTGIGIVIGIMFAKYFKKIIVNAWFLSILVSTVGMLFSFRLAPEFTIVIFYLCAGFGLSTTVPIMRMIYKFYEEQGTDSNYIMMKQWVYGSVISLLILPLGMISDLNIVKLNINIELTFLSMSIIGLASGFVMVKIARSMRK